MVIINVKKPKEDEKSLNIDKYIVNHIIPVGIKHFERNFYFLLFVAHQDCTDKDLYLQVVIQADDSYEENYFDTHYMNVNVISKDREKLDAYTGLTEKLRASFGTNLYATDFDMKESEKYSGYYHTVAIKDNSLEDIKSIYIPRSNYIRLRLYLNTHNIDNARTYYCFEDSRFNNIEYVNIEKVVHDATAQNDENNISHYTMWCGPSVFKMNVVTPITDGYKDKKLANPLHLGLYDSFYSKHCYVNDILMEPDDRVGIIYEDPDTKKLKFLILNSKLVKKTNFKNINNYIYE